MSDEKHTADMEEPAEATLREHAQRLEEEDRQRRAAEEEMDLNVFDGIRSQNDNPVQPVKIKESDSFCFSCHKGVSCWNVCCHGADITLTPYDILRLTRRFQVKPEEFLKAFTVPAMWHGADMPVAKLRMRGDDGKGACPFMDDEEGCTVYEDRPVNCRYYPLGMAAVKMKGHEAPEDFYFLVREDHCKGHDEDNEQSVSAFRKEQKIEPYDLLNRRWIEILMRLASWKVVGGPEGKEIPDQTKKMFFMVSTDVEMFRRFVFETKFLDTYEIDDDMVENLKVNDETMLQLGFDWMQNVLFNEPTLMMKEEVLQEAIAKARAEAGAAGEG